MVLLIGFICFIFTICTINVICVYIKLNGIKKILNKDNTDYFKSNIK